MSARYIIGDTRDVLATMGVAEAKRAVARAKEGMDRDDA